MTSYTAQLYTAANWAETTIKASAPKRALAAARRLAGGDLSDLDFQHYDDIGEVECIEIRTLRGEAVAQWESDEVRLRHAGSEMLAALEQALIALNTAPRFNVPILGVIDSYAVAAICEAAIAAAKGGAA